MNAKLKKIISLFAGMILLAFAGTMSLILTVVGATPVPTDAVSIILPARFTPVLIDWGANAWPTVGKPYLGALSNA